MNLSHWFKEIKQQSEENAMIFLIANKKDKSQEREVSTSKGQQFATEKGLDGFFETSAKTGEGVEETFIHAAKVLLKMHYRAIKRKQLISQRPKNQRLRKS